MMLLSPGCGSMLGRSRALCLALIMALIAGAARPPGPIFSEDFDSPMSARRVALLRSTRVEVIAGEGVRDSKALRVTYAGNDHGSERVVSVAPLAVPGIERTLEYDVRFDRDFQFVRGGKLYGLGSRHPVAGGEPLRPDGWSARVMWREGGVAETYTYHQDQHGKYGDAGDRLLPFRFARNRWYAISLQVRVNEPASTSNGFVRLFIDGRLLERRENLRLRATDTLDSQIATLLFSTFHGGDDPSWAPRDANGDYADVHAYFDNFAVYPGRLVRRKTGE
jgi:hypothetical protein